MSREIYFLTSKNVFTRLKMFFFNTVPKEFHFPRYNMKCSGENLILREKVHVVSCFPLHFMLYRGNLDCFSDSVREKYCLFTRDTVFFTVYIREKELINKSLSC